MISVMQTRMTASLHHLFPGRLYHQPVTRRFALPSVLVGVSLFVPLFPLLFIFDACVAGGRAVWRERVTDNVLESDVVWMGLSVVEVDWLLCWGWYGFGCSMFLDEFCCYFLFVSSSLFLMQCLLVDRFD